MHNSILDDKGGKKAFPYVKFAVQPVDVMSDFFSSKFCQFPTGNIALLRAVNIREHGNGSPFPISCSELVDWQL